jgi:hypothetical protein
MHFHLGTMSFFEFFEIGILKFQKYVDVAKYDTMIVEIFIVKYLII